MADVFVSYKAEDRHRVQPLVIALQKDGFSIWWDAHLGAGQDWRDRIARELDVAKSVVVAWSEGSVGPSGRFVRDEAARAVRRGVYVPVKLDPVEPPLGFGETQAVSLIGWSGRRSARQYRALQSTIAALLRGETIDEIGTQEVRGQSRRNVITAGVSATAVLAVGGGWWWQRRHSLPPEAQRLLDDAREGVQDGGVEANANAIGKLRHASDVAPKSAQIWGLLALAYMQQARMAPAQDKPDLQSRGYAAVRRAQTLDPDQPEAAAAQIFAMPMFGNWYAVERSARAALRRHPDNPFLMLRLCELLFQVGRHEECLNSLAKVVTQISTPMTHVGHVTLLWNLGRLDEAEAELKKAFDLWPRHFAVWFTRFYYLAYTGRASEAEAFIQDTAGRPVGIPDWNFAIVRSQAAAIASKSQSAISSTLSALKEASHRAAGFAENAALFAGYTGLLDEVFVILNGLYLNRGLKVGESWFSPEQSVYVGSERNTYILFQQQMAAVRKSPRFRQLTRDIGLADYWQRTGSLSNVIS